MVDPFPNTASDPMKYVCLCYADEGRLERMPQDELDALLREQVAYEDALRDDGCVAASEAVEPSRTATTIRVRSGKLSITDGPFAETKEQLAGFFLIEACDLNDAIRIATHSPSARVGCVEIRPIWPVRTYVRTLRTPQRPLPS